MSKKGRRPKARRSLPGSAGPRPPDPALGRAILSGDVSIDEAAAALLRLHAGRPCRVTLAARVAHETSAERMAAIAAEVVRQAPDSLTTLSFGAQAASLRGDHTLAVAHIDAALARAEEDANLRTTRAAVLVEAGRIADALDDIGRLCRAEPENPVAQGLRAVALAEADQRTGGPPAGSCPCGSGRAFSRCCGPREAAALRQFSERAGWDELRSAVLEYATRTEDLTDAILDTWSQAQERCPGGTALAPWDPELGLALDWGLTAITFGDPDGGGDDVPALAAFSADPEVIDERPGLSHQWLAHHRFGAWQCPPGQEGPGLELVDLVSGLTIYADVPGALSAIEPWAVLLALMVPDEEGTWRSGGGLVVLSPMEGDELVGRILEMARGLPDASLARTLRKVPPNVPPALLAEQGTIARLDIGDLLSGILTGSLPELAAAARILRAPQLNSDDEPVEMVDATIPLGNVQGVRAALRRRSDMTPSPGGDLVWTGRVLGSDQGKPLLTAPLGRGARPEPAREGEIVARALLRFSKGALMVSVNSRPRLDAVLALLREIDPGAAVVEEQGEVPGHTAVWEKTLGGVSPDAVAAWERAWPDQPLRALDSLTPRRAARLPRQRLRLELVLRELEFHAAQARRAGYPIPNLAALRASLRMEGPGGQASEEEEP